MNHRLGNGIDKSKVILLIIVAHQLDDHFGVGLAVESVAMLQQLFFQLGIILNNSVMYTDNLIFYRTRT